MSPQTAAASSQLVRLSLQWESERIDVGVPGGVPVAEVLPSLTRRLRMLDSASASSGFRLVQANGAALDGDRTLSAQGVQDGDLLVLEQGGRATLSKRYDDLVEAVADAVERNAPAWSKQNSVTTATVVAATLLLLGLVPAMWGWVSSGEIVVAAGVGAAAVVLLICALVMNRTGAPPQATMALALVSSVYVGAAGYCVLGQPGWGAPLAIGGGAMAMFGIVAMVTLKQKREYGLIPIAVGGALLVVGLLIGLFNTPVVGTLAATMAIAGIAGLGAPWLALASVPLRIISARDESEVYNAPKHISPDEVARLYNRAHRYQVSLRISLCIIVLVATVPVVASGIWGMVLCVVTYLGMFLGTRQVYSGFDIIVVAAGVLCGVILGVTTAMVTHPAWIGGLVVGLATTAVCIIVVVLLSPRARLGLTRFADFAEWGTIALLMPLAIIAGGWF